MKIENTTEASADAVAHLLGITSRQVQRLVKTGIIPRTARGHYDLAASVQAWGAYLAQGKTTAEIGTERRRLIAAQASKTELDVRRMNGELLDAEDVAIVLNEAMTIIATGLDGLGGRLAAELASLTDTAVIRQRLLTETRRIRGVAADKLAALGAIGRAGGPSAPGRKAVKGKRRR